MTAGLFRPSYVDPLPQKNLVLQGCRLEKSFCERNKEPLSVTLPNLEKKFLAEKNFFSRKIFFDENFLTNFPSNSYAQF